jgi:hypothetical protein
MELTNLIETLRPGMTGKGRVLGGKGRGPLKLSANKPRSKNCRSRTVPFSYDRAFQRFARGFPGHIQIDQAACFGFLRQPRRPNAPRAGSGSTVPHKTYNAFWVVAHATPTVPPHRQPQRSSSWGYPPNGDETTPPLAYSPLPLPAKPNVTPPTVKLEVVCREFGEPVPRSRSVNPAGAGSDEMFVNLENFYSCALTGVRGNAAHSAAIAANTVLVFMARVPHRHSDG